MSDPLSARRPLLAAVVLSACVGLAGGAAAAWAIYQRLGPAERIVSSPAANTGSGQGGGPTYASLAAAAAPSIVKVVTRQLTPADLLAGAPGRGTGFVASSDGLVVTTAHALAGASRLQLAFADGHVTDASVAATDLAHGLVVLRAADSKGLTPLSFADFDRQAPRPGDLAIAVGDRPLAGLSVTVGTISSVGGFVSLTSPPPAAGAAPALLDVISVVATDDPLDDGAPLLDDSGRVIGVVVAPAPGGVGGLIALNGRSAAQLVSSLARGTSSSRPTFGADAVLLDAAHSAAVHSPAGAEITSVAPGGPADTAGLQRGDVVTAVDGGAIDSGHPFDAQALGLSPGQRVSVSIFRDGSERNVSLVIGG